jgi:hypothetical protein
MGIEPEAASLRVLSIGVVDVLRGKKRSNVECPDFTTG